MRLIGLTGKKGCGKTAAAEFLRDMVGWEVASFADPLREICKTAFGLTDHEMADRELKETPLTRWPFRSPRELLQKVGTDLFREHYPEVWIKAFERRFETPRIHVPANFGIVVADVRFLNEAEAIRRIGGEIIRITRPGLVSSDSHVSETEMDRIYADTTIENSGSLKDLQQSILKTVLFSE